MDETRGHVAGTPLPGALVCTFALAVALEPLWSFQFPVIPQLTLGRAAIVAVAGMAIREGIRTGVPGTVPRPAIALGAGLVGLWTWVIINSDAWGCSCTGAKYGFSEVAAVTALAALVTWFRADSVATLLAGAALGGLLAAVLAVVGVHDVHSGVPAPSGYGSRLWGANGNPNFLAFSVALVLPTLLAFRVGHPRRRALIEYLVLAFCTVVIALTLSRGGVLAAGAGAVLVLFTQAPDRRQRLILYASVAAVVLAGLLLYPKFQRIRLQADYPHANQSSPIDRSGWDTNEIGLVGAGGSRLANTSRGVLQVVTSSSGEGVSYRIGNVPADRPIHLVFWARSDLQGLTFDYGLNDALSVDRPAIRQDYLSPVWRKYTLDWRPLRTPGQARVFFWQLGGATSFDLASVRISGTTESRQPIHSPSLHLLGVGPRQTPVTAAESRYVQSRVTDLRMAVDALGTQPIRGIGFDTFGRYSARHASFGAQPTHNEYTQIAAELGLLGVALFALLIAAIVAALRYPWRSWHAGAVGTLAAGAVGLLFINGLQASNVVLPLAVAVGALCGGARPAPLPAVRREPK